MTAEVSTLSFARAVSWVCSLASNEVANMSLKIGKEGGVAYISDAALYAQAPFEVMKAEEDLEFSVELSFLKNFSKMLLDRRSGAGAELLMKSVRGSLEVKTHDSTHRCPTYASSPQPTVELDKLGVVDHEEFRDVLLSASSLADAKAASVVPLLGTVDLFGSKESLTVVGTDRKTLGEFVIGETAAKDWDTHVHLPLSAARIDKSEDGSLTELVRDEETKRFGFQFADGRLALYSTVLVDSLDYRAMFDRFESATEFDVAVNGSEFVRAVRNVSTLANFNEVDVDFNSDSIVVSDRAKRNTVSLPLVSSTVEDECRFAFEADSLLKGLTSVPGETLSILLGKGQTPLIVRPVSAGGAIDTSCRVLISCLMRKS